MIAVANDERYGRTSGLLPLAGGGAAIAVVSEPAAAVIPAPIAYIKVVAVKKLVVGF